MTVQQFDLFGDAIPEQPDPIEVRPATDAERHAFNPHSYGRRLTEKLHELAAEGRNPLIGSRGPDGQTCGDCVHRQHFQGGARSYPKCDLGPQTSGPKTDVRAFWPACHRFEPTA